MMPQCNALARSGIAMNRVKVSFVGMTREMPLEIALAPEADGDRDGAVEHASETADKACEAVGKLLALLVNKHVLTLYEACDIAGQYRTVTFVTDDDIPF